MQMRAEGLIWPGVGVTLSSWRRPPACSGARAARSSLRALMRAIRKWRLRSPQGGPETGRSLAAAMDLELVENVVDVVLHRGRLDPQLPRDLLVGQTAVDEIADLQFALRERGAGRFRRRTVVTIARQDRHMVTDRCRSARRAQEFVAHRALENSDHISRRSIATPESRDAGGRQGDDFSVGLGNPERHDLRSRYLIRESSCVAEIARARRIEQHDVGAQLGGLRPLLHPVVPPHYAD